MKAFISYSHRDAAALARLHVHLAMLRREGLIEEWFDREILVGSSIDAEVSAQMEECEVFLLLLSPDFLNSDYCYNREMTRALERHRLGDALVVPIVIEPCDWAACPLRELKTLPRDGKPVSDWTNANNAYLDVTQELRRVLANGPPKEHPEVAVHMPVEERSLQRRYRIKRDFDEIDRSEFCETAFTRIRDYFERAITELDSIEDLRGKFNALSPTSFSCTIVNRARTRGAAHITVHRRSSGFALGDIYYSFSEDAPPNTANGGFSVEADEFELYLTAQSFGFGDGEKRLSPENAAERLWTEFLQQAGVDYD